eukprot:2336045-Karenia_brevis.AAC.1
MPNHNIQRQAVFEANSINEVQNSNRRRGRPRNTWARELKIFVDRVAIFHDMDIEFLMQSEARWDHAIKSYFQNDD